MRLLRISVVFGLLVTAQICSAGTWYGKETEHLAVFKNSVTDLVITLPLAKTNAVSSFGDDSQVCRRSHQGLFNEVVSVVQEQAEEVQVSFSTIIYGFAEQTKEPLSTFWVSRKQLIFFRDLEAQGADLSLFPAPLGRSFGLSIVLTLPWRSYSVGTRFVRVPAYDTPSEYGIRFFDVAKQRPVITKLPRDNAHIEVKRSEQQSRKLCLQVMNRLVDHVASLPGNKIIPYVWGGSSSLSFSGDGKFTHDDKAWIREEAPVVWTGYDCSEFILRMTQIAGLLYPYKTTGALWEQGVTLAADEPLEDGDLIVVQGHVMMLNNVKKHEVIEARGYPSGYGRVQRIPLKELFEGITTCDDLRVAFFAHQPLQMLQLDGSRYKLFPEFKLIKLCKTAAQGVDRGTDKN